MEPSQILAPLVQRWSRRVALTVADHAAILALPSVQKSYGREAYIVREGEPTSTCNLLLTGFAYRQKLVVNGSRQIISIHIPGEFVDLQHALLPVADHNVQSLGRSELAAIPRSALVDLITARPLINRALWLDTLLDASIFREWVVNVGRRDARARIAHLLCELSVRLQGAGVPRAEATHFPFTQELLADATGLTSVHVNRTLQALRHDGLISLSDARLTVLDWPGLAETGDFSERYLHHEA